MQAWEEKALARMDGIEIGRSEGLSEGSLHEKQNIIRRLLAKNVPDADILELADCGQALLDEVRKTPAAS